MRTTPPTPDEIDVWIDVLSAHGHLHRADPGPAGAWTVQRTPTSVPHTFHHPILAYDYIIEILRDIRLEAGGSPR
ncbi:hypothetical protein [Streptomyces yatensis]|uniref:PH domain-containing protein n=1 Tax=Streptomyces yatensis TaxID=155177 RepID=A0ABP4UQT9_9ACTN|nr:hypothetical protein [Streptomyces yatensis]